MIPLLLVSLLVAPVVQEAGERNCGFCSTTGKTEVEVDGKWSVEHERGVTWQVEHCSEAFASDNMALDWEPCRRCKTPSLQEAAMAEHEAHRAIEQAWLNERRKVDEVVEPRNDLVHVETTHISITTDISKVTTVDKKTYRTHELAHLYAQRFEELYAEFQELHGIQDSNNMKNKHYVLMFEKQAQMRAGGPAFTGLQGDPSVKRAGGAQHESTIVGWWAKNYHPTDADLHRHFAHNLIHQFTAVYYDLKWFEPGELGLLPPWLHDKYGWIDEGLAHWYERRLPGRSVTYCFREQDGTSRWKGDDWAKNVWKAVGAEDVPKFAGVITKPTPALTAKDHQFCWSWVDWLMAQDPAAVGRMMRMAKEKHATRDLLKEQFGLTMLDFEAKWGEWVREAYAPSKR